MNPLRRLRTALTLIAVCLAGVATAAAVASGGTTAQGGDDSTGTTGESTGGSTGTTGESTGTTGETTNTTTTPGSTSARAPRIVEIEVDAVSGERLRLRAEVTRRGARVTKVRFTYRGVKYDAVRNGSDWSRVVAARGGDSRGDEVTFRVTACAGSRCTSRTGTDEAGGGRRGRGND
jgi:hypothetical protein